MLKRLIAAGSVSIMAVVGLAPAATAATTSHHTKIVKAIDWDAPAPSSGSGGATTNRIDWD